MVDIDRMETMSDQSAGKREEAEVFAPVGSVRDGEAVAGGAKAAGAKGGPRGLPEIGSVVVGRVVGFTDNGSAMVKLPQGMGALLPAHEYSWVDQQVDLSKWLKRGQDIDVVVRKIKMTVDGWAFITVSHRRTKADPWASVEREHPVGSKTWACVREIAEGHLFVELETGYRAMVHRSELCWENNLRSAETMFAVGQWVEVVIESIDAEKRRIGASHRLAQENPWASIERVHPVGSTATGTVKVLHVRYMLVKLETGFVVKVDRTEMVWERPSTDPRMVCTQGQRIEVMILGIDVDGRRIEASYRQATADPWAGFSRRFPVGTELTVVVEQVVPFGAFVTLPDQLVGLLHTTGMFQPTAARCVGESVRVRVVEFDASARRIRLAELAGDDAARQSRVTRAAA